MKNYEKYENEIIQLTRNAADDCTAFVIPNVLRPMGFDCNEKMTCEACNRLFSVWLLNDYKEPKIDWSKISVDTKVYVKDNENDQWVKRYFAKYEKGKVHTWMYGSTSWTSDGIEIENWEYAKLAEVEE